jgi:hypothetical protein
MGKIPSLPLPQGTARQFQPVADVPRRNLSETCARKLHFVVRQLEATSCSTEGDQGEHAAVSSSSSIMLAGFKSVVEALASRGFDVGKEPFQGLSLGVVVRGRKYELRGPAARRLHLLMKTENHQHRPVFQHRLHLRERHYPNRRWQPWPR